MHPLNRWDAWLAMKFKKVLFWYKDGAIVLKFKTGKLMNVRLVLKMTKIQNIIPKEITDGVNVKMDSNGAMKDAKKLTVRLRKQEPYGMQININVNVQLVNVGTGIINNVQQSYVKSLELFSMKWPNTANAQNSIIYLTSKVLKNMLVIILILLSKNY